MCIGSKHLTLFLPIGTENMATVLKLERNALLIGQKAKLAAVCKFLEGLCFCASPNLNYQPHTAISSLPDIFAVYWTL